MDSTTHTTTTVEFVDWRAKAKAKLEAEDKLFKGGRAAKSVQSYVLRTLLGFVDQEPRFAEVVCNTQRTFSECCAAVVNNAGEVLSDLETYRRAVQFYFPNAEVSFSMNIKLTGAPPTEAEMQAPAIQGTLSGDNNRLLMCGNPTQNTGTFHDSHTVDAQSYYCMKVSSRDSPRTNKQNIADLERKFGKNSNVVRVRVDGEFPENEDDVFIPMALATKAVNTEPLEHCSPARISIGCDVARFGNDDTAIAQNIDGDIQKLVTRHGQDLYATADDIIAIYKTLRAAYPQYRGLIYAVIDDTGVGGGVTDILNREKIRQKLTKLMVVPVNFSSAVPDKEAAGRYADIATWMWAVLRDMATAGTLHIPNDSTLIGQLTTRKYIFSGAPAKLKLESKDALKKRGLTSPDRADAAALALYEGGIFDVRSLI